MSGAVGRRLLGNILHEGHSVSISQDFPWVKMRYLLFHVHESFVCIPGGLLQLMWQQESWHGCRGLQLDRKQRFLTPVLCLQFILSCCTNDMCLSLFSIDEIALCDFFRLFCVFWQNTTAWATEKKVKFVSHSSEAGGLRSGCPCGQVRALLQVTGFSLYNTIISNHSFHFKWRWDLKKKKTKLKTSRFLYLPLN